LETALFESQQEIDRLMEEPASEELPLLPRDFKFHSLVLDKLDKDLDELMSRRHSELVSGQHTPIKESSPLNSEFVFEEDGVLHSEQGRESVHGNGLNGSVHLQKPDEPDEPEQPEQPRKPDDSEEQEESEKPDTMPTDEETLETSGPTAWEQLWQGLALLSGFHDPEDMK
jgi:hypothetical protein